MKRFALVICLGVVGAGFGQLPTTSVSFVCRAATADRALAALGKIAGVTLLANETTAHEVLVISAQNVPLADLMTRIATATSAEWRHEGAGYRLVPAESVRQQQEAADLAAHTAAIRKVVHDGMNPPKPPKVATAAKGDGEGDEDVAQGFVDGQNTEQPRVYEVLNATDLSALAELGSNQRIVFSTRPTAMQRPFADDISAPLDAIVASHNAGVAKIKSANSGAEAVGEELSASEKAMLERMNKPIGAVAKVTLVVSKLGFWGFDMTQVELRIYDPNGNVSYSQDLSLELPGTGMGEIMVGLRVNGEKPSAAVKETPVEISDDTKAMGAMFQILGPNGSALTLNPTLLNKLRHPDQFDPLSFMATDDVLSLAKKQGRPLVAALPDDAVSIMSLAMADQRHPTVEQFEKHLANAVDSRIVPDPAWLVIAPAHPTVSRGRRMDREALATLIQQAEGSGVVSLDELAAFSLSSPSPMDGGIGALYLLLMVPGAFTEDMVGFMSWDTLRLYGSLDPVRRQTLFEGGRVPMASFTPFQLELVHRMAFGAMLALHVDDGSHKEDSAAPNTMGMFGGGGSGDYRDEATELLPNGLPSDGFVTVKTSSARFASPVPKSDKDMIPGVFAVLDASALASEKFRKDSSEMAQNGGGMPSLSQLRVGQTVSYAFTFQVAAKVSMHSRLNDHRLDKGSPIVTTTGLPVDFQRQIDVAYAELKKTRHGATMGMPGMPPIHP